MRDLIDRNDLLDHSYCTAPTTWDNPYGGDCVVSVKDIENAPIVDAVQVIRCEDCVYYSSKGHICRNRPGEEVVSRRPDDFCSRAIRRKDEK